VRRVPASWSALGAAVALAAAVSGCGSGSGSGSGSSVQSSSTTPATTSTVPASPAPAGSSAATLGALAGYVRPGTTTAVSAGWAVPAIATASHAGIAGTWIGAQAPGPKETAPFIQIGTNEDRSANTDTYTAFWSDTAHHFHPVRLFAVAPGDRVSASMQLGAGHWTLLIRDVNSGAHQRVRTTQEATGSFNEGQWLQEDVTDTRTGRTFSYPQLSRVHFRRLSFDGRRVDDGAVSSQWMTLGAHRGLAPTALRNGTFVLRPQTLSAPAQGYLRLTTPVSQALAQLTAQSENPAASTLAARLRSSAEALSRALTAADTGLAQGSWPAAARRPITTLIAADRRLIAVLPALPRGVVAQSDRTQARFVRAATAQTTADRSVRRALDAPDLP
jgi:hypothetical protein